MIIVGVETRTGNSWVTCLDETDRQQHLALELTESRNECLRLAAELLITNPQRAATLTAAAQDPTRIAYDLWGLAKNDGRPPREAEPSGEETIKDGVRRA